LFFLQKKVFDSKDLEEDGGEQIQMLNLRIRAKIIHMLKVRGERKGKVLHSLCSSISGSVDYKSRCG